MPGNVVVNNPVPRRLRQAGEANDVYAMVKMQMSDSVLIQEPLNVWPSSFLTVTESFFNKINTTRHVVQQILDPERVEELETLRRAIEKDFPHLRRGANYYKTLVDSSRLRQPYYKLGFVESGPNASQRIANVQLGARAPPPRPHCLQVVFHRRWISAWDASGGWSWQKMLGESDSDQSIMIALHISPWYTVQITTWDFKNLFIWVPDFVFDCSLFWWDLNWFQHGRNHGVWRECSHCEDLCILWTSPNPSFHSFIILQQLWQI